MNNPQFSGKPVKCEQVLPKLIHLIYLTLQTVAGLLQTQISVITTFTSLHN